MKSEQSESYVVVDGEKVTMKELVKSNPKLADMIYEGSYGDPDEAINTHMEFTTKQSSI